MTVFDIVVVRADVKESDILGCEHIKVIWTTTFNNEKFAIALCVKSLILLQMEQIKLTMRRTFKSAFTS